MYSKAMPNTENPTTPATATELRTHWNRVSLGHADATYRAGWIGHPAVHTTAKGERMVGVIEWPEPTMYPVIQFPDGTWARQTSDIELVVTGR